MKKTICLASNSPRRRELIKYLNRPFTAFSVDIDEKCDDKNPAEYVSDVALAKEAAVEEIRGIGDDEIVITADTCVAIDDVILGKPADREEAKNMLRRLSGRTHTVCTGVVVAQKVGERIERHSLCETSRVTFVKLKENEIEEYVATGEPMDKAGAYAIQGMFSKYICRIEGDYNNIVGFPVAAVYQLLNTIENGQT